MCELQWYCERSQLLQVISSLHDIVKLHVKIMICFRDGVDRCHYKRKYAKLFAVLFKSILRLPKDGLIRQKWIDKITNHQIFSTSDSRTPNFDICALHFNSDMIKTGKVNRLKPGALPTIFPDKNNINAIVPTNTVQLESRKMCENGW